MVHRLSITLSLRKTSQESINLERKSYLDCSLDTLCTRGEFGRLRYWLQTLRSWKRWTCKGSNISLRKWNNSSCRWTNQIFWRSGTENTHLCTGTPNPRRRSKRFLGKTEGSPPLPPRDSLPDAGEAVNDFWSMSGNFIYRHHVEPRVKLYSPREESFPIPLKYIDVSRTAHTNKKAASMTIGISMDQEICLILGQVSLSLLYEVRNLQKDFCGPGGD